MRLPFRFFSTSPLTMSALLCALVISGIVYIQFPAHLLAQKNEQDSSEEAIYPPDVSEEIRRSDSLPPTAKDASVPSTRTGKYVVVELDKMTITLVNGSSSETMPLVSQGKPGRYYETIGGEHLSNYKIKNHFSSIGHVYMPWSVHVFGNYFIHGIPYYPDGTKVSSTYSGGCVRMADDDAKKVYDFVERGTPIILTREGSEAFTPSLAASSTVEDMTMTRLMVTTISLEILPQDNEIIGLDGEMTTRRKMIPDLIRNKNDAVSRIYAQALSEKTFVEYMNTKARAIGLTNTVFTGTKSPALTTEEDQLRFAHYIDTYKSYIRAIERGE